MGKAVAKAVAEAAKKWCSKNMIKTRSSMRFGFFFPLFGDNFHWFLYIISTVPAGAVFLKGQALPQE